MLKLKEWWCYHKPIITNRVKQLDMLVYNYGISQVRAEKLIKSLLELRKNTWDKQRVDNIIEEIKDNTRRWSI